MSPHFGPCSRAIERTGNPSAQFVIEPELDHDASSLVVGLGPHARTEAPYACVAAFNAREAIAMEIGKMFPIDRVLVQSLKAHRQLATVGSGMRHPALALKVRAHTLLTFGKW